MDGYLEGTCMTPMLVMLISGIVLFVLGGKSLVGALLPTPDKGRVKGRSRSAASALLGSIGVLAYASAIITYAVMRIHHSSFALASRVFMSGALVFIIATLTGSFLDRRRKL